MTARVMSLEDVPRLVRGPGAQRTPLKTLGLVGDVHAEDARLELALEVLARRGVERIACVGDVADGEGSLARACALLDAHGVLTVAGNHERWLLSDRMRELPYAHHLAREPEDVWRFCRFLPPMLELATVAGPALLCHAVAWDDMLVVDPDTEDGWARRARALADVMRAGRFAWMLAGHTHRFMLRRFDHLGIVNAGTLSRRDPAPCIVRVDFEARLVEHVAIELGEDGGGARVGATRTLPLP